VSDFDKSRAGMCAAFGCPLFGTVGSDGQWYCFCHVNKPAVFNDSITHELRENQKAVVDVTLGIRRRAHGLDIPTAALKALKAHPMGAELKFNQNVDVCARAWLMRLERHLIDSTSDIGEQKRLPATVPTAPVVGPTHAMTHYSEPRA
jgi:hypothetical protein